MVGIPPRPTGIAMVNHEAVSDTATDDARPHTKKETITGDVVNEIKNLQVGTLFVKIKREISSVFLESWCRFVTNVSSILRTISIS